MSKTRLDRLKEEGSLNRKAAKVQDKLFLNNEFFDPNDVVQVKYEMLRRVEHAEMTVKKAAQLFGLSRPIFYQAKLLFQTKGIMGLIPEKRGPKSGYKLKDEIITYVIRLQAEEPRLKMDDIVQKIQEKFKMSIHKRSVERALKQQKKKRVKK